MELREALSDFVSGIKERVAVVKQRLKEIADEARVRVTLARKALGGERFLGASLSGRYGTTLVEPGSLGWKYDTDRHVHILARATRELVEWYALMLLRKRIHDGMEDEYMTISAELVGADASKWTDLLDRMLDERRRDIMNNVRKRMEIDIDREHNQYRIKDPRLDITYKGRISSYSMVKQNVERVEDHPAFETSLESFPSTVLDELREEIELEEFSAAEVHGRG